MLTKTPRTTPKTKSDRISFDRDEANAILDEAMICHVAFADDEGPVVLPTIHWRIGQTLYFHGSHASRMSQALASGRSLCVTATLLDGLVMARSAFWHTMNFRSVVLFGQGSEVKDLEEKTRAFDALMEKVAPGRQPHLRPTTQKELVATKLIAMPIEEGSVKCRQGPPGDAEGDESWPVWAGILPLSLQAGEPIAEERVRPEMTLGKP